MGPLQSHRPAHNANNAWQDGHSGSSYLNKKSAGIGADELHDASFSDAHWRPPALFHLGKTVITPGAAGVLDSMDVFTALRRHVTGDWGELGAEDRIANDEAVASGGRILSAYISKGAQRFWIITEADRSVTTVLLPEEY